MTSIDNETLVNLVDGCVQKKLEEKAAKEAIESRRGVKDILANSQIGFTKKLKDDKTEEEENVLGGLM